jgi:hypothetical protein
MSWTITSGGVPAAIAGVAPLVDYRFAVDRNEIDAVSLTDKLTVTTVDADGTFVNQAGLIQQATTNIPRFDHGPASRQSLGLLVEESRENLLLRSEEFDNAYWIKVNSSTIQNAAVDPRGTTTAQKLLTNTTNNIHCVRRDETVLASSAYTLSFYAKAGEYTFLAINHGHTLVADFHTFFNLSSGTIGTSAAGNSPTIQAAGNGWYRCSVTRTTGVSQTSLSSRALACQSDNVVAFTGDTSSGIFIWGAQLEVGSFPTSYIPTTTTATTRSADDIKIAAGLSGTADVDYTIVEKPAGCVAVSGSDIVLNTGFTAQRVMVFPGNVSALRTAIRAAM